MHLGLGGLSCWQKNVVKDDSNDLVHHSYTSFNSHHQSFLANLKNPFLRGRSLVYSYKLLSAKRSPKVAIQ